MKAKQRIYRTNDNRLVLEGDLDAAYLAYAAGDDVENKDADEVRALVKEDDDESSDDIKKQAAPANKKQAASRNK